MKKRLRMARCSTCAKMFKGPYANQSLASHVRLKHGRKVIYAFPGLRRQRKPAIKSVGPRDVGARGLLAAALSDLDRQRARYSEALAILDGTK